MSKQSKNKKTASSEDEDWDAILEAEIAANKAIKGSSTPATATESTTIQQKQEANAITAVETVLTYFFHSLLY
jgi:hypothetical protein